MQILNCRKRKGRTEKMSGLLDEGREKKSKSEDHQGDAETYKISEKKGNNCSSLEKQKEEGFDVWLDERQRTRGWRGLSVLREITIK